MHLDFRYPDFRYPLYTFYDLRLYYIANIIYVKWKWFIPDQQQPIRWVQIQQWPPVCRSWYLAEQVWSTPWRRPCQWWRTRCSWWWRAVGWCPTRKIPRTGPGKHGPWIPGNCWSAKVGSMLRANRLWTPGIENDNFKVEIQWGSEYRTNLVFNSCLVHLLNV